MFLRLEKSCVYNSHWPFALSLQLTATINELLNPDVQLEAAVLNWNQDFLSVFLSFCAWLTLESPDSGLRYIHQLKVYHCPDSQMLKKESNIKHALSRSGRLSDVNEYRNVAGWGVCYYHGGCWAGARPADGMASP